MAVITRLTASGERSRKVRVYLDGRYAFSLEPEVALGAKLRVNRNISQTQLDEIGKRNELKRALAAAERLLSFRPRSEKELAQKLAQKKFGELTIAAALTYLREHGLVDDTAFARYWTENRTTFSPRSQRLVQLELRQKGVTAEVAQETSGEVNDEAAAFSAGLKKASRLDASDYKQFHRRLGEYLKRRGFGYDVIDRSVKRLWQEIAHKE